MEDSPNTKTNNLKCEVPDTEEKQPVFFNTTTDKNLKMKQIKLKSPPEKTPDLMTTFKGKPDSSSVFSSSSMDVQDSGIHKTDIVGALPATEPLTHLSLATSKVLKCEPDGNDREGGVNVQTSSVDSFTDARLEGSSAAAKCSLENEEVQVKQEPEDSHATLSGGSADEMAYTSQPGVHPVALYKNFHTDERLPEVETRIGKQSLPTPHSSEGLADGKIKLPLVSEIKTEPQCAQQFHCSECAVIFEDYTQLELHVRTRHQKSKYLCVASSLYKADKRKANRGAKSKTCKGKKMLQCSECALTFSSSGRLKFHSKTHTNKIPHTCLECGKEFRKMCDLKRHSRLHSGEKPFQCSECLAAFRQSCDLKMHMRTHTGDKPFQCAGCRQTFSRSSRLKKHANVRHLQELLQEVPLYQCSQCLEVFKEMQELTKHTESHPVGKGPDTSSKLEETRNCTQTPKDRKLYQCPECSVVFKNVGDLNRHLRTHTGERPYKCCECPAAFRQQSHLNGHMLKHTGTKPFPCPQCPQSFRRKSHLAEHIGRRHSYPQESKNECTFPKPLQCRDCDASFRYNSELKRHAKKHTGEKPFQCPECCAMFAHSFSLRDHLARHSENLPYQCSKCMQTFLRPSYLKRHMESKHPDNVTAAS